MADVFISHIHEEATVALALQAYLEVGRHTRVSVFLTSNPWQMYAGEDWLARIKHEIVSCRAIILLLNQTSITRPWINFEAGAAWFAEKLIIPVCVGKLSISRLPRPYADLQAIQLPDQAEQLQMSLIRHLSQPVDPFRPDDTAIIKALKALQDACHELSEHH